MTDKVILREEENMIYVITYDEGITLVDSNESFQMYLGGAMRRDTEDNYIKVLVSNILDENHLYIVHFAHSPTTHREHINSFKYKSDVAHWERSFHLVFKNKSRLNTIYYKILSTVRGFMHDR